MRASGGLRGELAGGEGALQGVVLVLDLLQLEVLPAAEVEGTWNKFIEPTYRNVTEGSSG